MKAPPRMSGVREMVVLLLWCRFCIAKWTKEVIGWEAKASVRAHCTGGILVAVRCGGESRGPRARARNRGQMVP